MKRLLAVVTASALAAIAAVTTVPPKTATAAVAGASIGTFCQQYAGSSFSEFVIPSGQGECARFVATLGPSICKGEGLFGLPGYELLGFPNQGACVSTIQKEARDFLKNLENGGEGGPT